MSTRNWDPEDLLRRASRSYFCDKKLELEGFLVFLTSYDLYDEIRGLEVVGEDEAERWGVFLELGDLLITVPEKVPVAGGVEGAGGAAWRERERSATRDGMESGKTTPGGSCLIREDQRSRRG